MKSNPYEINVLHDDKWKVTFDGQEYGPFPTEVSAMEAAIAAGSKAASLGMDVVVSINP